MTGMTDGRVRKIPFTPGSGIPPPCLAGRDEEQERFRAVLDDLTDGFGPSSDLILFGPRGTGKTSLMKRFRSDCLEGDRVDALAMTPDDLASSSALVAALAGAGAPSVWEKAAERLGRIKSVGAAGFSVAFELGEGATGITPAFRDALAERCRAKPLCLLLDEAHMLEAEVGRTLLNLSQDVRSECPFALILAGTPHLERKLADMGASFWERSEVLPIGCLEPQAALDALQRPFVDRGIDADHGVLAPALQEAQAYPYFIQVWGRALWMAMRRDGRTPVLTGAHVQAAHAEFEDRRDAFYKRRMREIEDRGLFGPAAAVARAFGADAALTDSALESAIRAGLPNAADDRAALDAKRQLADLGFAWSPGGKDGWLPGIPSLMSYVVHRVPAQ